MFIFVNCKWTKEDCKRLVFFNDSKDIKNKINKWNK